MKTTNAPDSVVPETIISINYPILFQSDDTSKVMLRKATHGHLDDSFLLPKNLIQPPTERRQDIQAINFGEEVDTGTARRFLTSLGKRLGCPEHLFALGYQYPNIIDELQTILERKRGMAASKALAPYEAGQAILIERILNFGKIKIVAIGREVATCVVDYDVFPVFSNNNDFGLGQHLIGYPTNRTKRWDTGCFFLAIAD